MAKYNFDKIPNRWNYYERRFDEKFIFQEFGLQGTDVLDFGIADINFETPDIIVDAIKKRASRKTFSYSYASEETCAAIKKWYLDWHNISLEGYYIKIAHGTVNAMYQIVQEFTNENDYVLLFTPLYKPFAKSVLLNNRKIVANKLKLNAEKMRYEIDFLELEKQIKEFKIKLLFLCHPHNPSSQIWTTKELTVLKGICEKYDVIVFSDEVHSGMVYHSFSSFLAMNYEKTIIGNSPNKAFNLGGLKSSYLIVKNKGIFDQIESRYQRNSITTPNVFVNDIFQVAYLNNDVKEWVKEFCDYILSNFNYLKQELEKLDMRVFNLESTYLVWIKTPISSVQIFNKLKEQKILINCANDFYDCQDNFIRINVATSKAQLKVLVESLKNIMKSNY